MCCVGGLLRIVEFDMSKRPKPLVTIDVKVDVAAIIRNVGLVTLAIILLIP